MADKSRRRKTALPESKPIQAVGVFGGGAWGSALSQAAARAGRDVTLWAYEFDTVAEINSHHTNRVYLPGVTLDRSVRATAKAKDAVSSDLVLLAVPSQFVRAVAQELALGIAPGTTIVICTKGFEESSGQLITGVVRQIVPQAHLAVLSGPSFAGDVARGLPVALTLACTDQSTGRRITAAMAHRSFRIYWTDDIMGAQVGGAVKNVLAIAAGIVDGRRLGASAHAAVTTRGFAELVRLGTRLGGRYETLAGLSGLGDLILTCSSSQSRNMSLGQALGQGRALEDILGGRRPVTEGVSSAGAIVALAKNHDVEMPICQAVHDITRGHLTVDEAIDAVLARPFRAEADDADASEARDLDDRGPRAD